MGQDQALGTQYNPVPTGAAPTHTPRRPGAVPRDAGGVGSSLTTNTKHQAVDLSWTGKLGKKKKKRLNYLQQNDVCVGMRVFWPHSPPHHLGLLSPEQNVVVFLQMTAPRGSGNSMVYMEAAVGGSWDTGQPLPPNTAPRIQGRDMGGHAWRAPWCSKGVRVYLGSLCPPESLGVCRAPVGALCGASTQGQAPRASSSLWRGTVTGQSPPAQSCSMSLLQQPPALHDQLGVRCKNLGAILTTLPRKCGVTLTFLASHSGEKDKLLFPVCSSLVLEKHPPIPENSCCCHSRLNLPNNGSGGNALYLTAHARSSCQGPTPRSNENPLPQEVPWSLWGHLLQHGGHA